MSSDRHWQHHEALSSAVVVLSRDAIRVPFILNGGALIMNFVATGKVAAAAAGYWFIGLILAAIVSGVAVWAQREFQVTAQKRAEGDAVAAGEYKDLGNTFRAVCFFLWGLSIAAFAVGGFIA